MLHCKKCKFVKNEEDFYISDPRTCKECKKKAAKDSRWSRIDDVRAMDRARGNRQPKEYLKQYRDKYPNKYRSHNKVNNALRDEKIERMSCEICGSEKSVAHHDDYSKPLNVR